MNNIPQVISLTTGMEVDKDVLWKDFQRIRNMVRVVNVRRGLRRKDERPPEDHWAVRDEAFEQKLLDDYYEFKGWNRDGVPTKETLIELDLDFVIDDFEQRGIWKENEGIPAKETAAAASATASAEKEKN